MNTQRTRPARACIRRRSRAGRAAALLGAAVLATGSARAADRYWFNRNQGDWFDQFNWSASRADDPPASVPGAGDRAVFDIGGTGYTVQFPDDVLVNALVVRNDPVVFDLQNHELTTQFVNVNNFIVGGILTVGAAGGDTGVLTLRDGTLTTPLAHIGLDVGPGRLDVEDSVVVHVRGDLDSFERPFTIGGSFLPLSGDGTAGDGTLDLRGTVDVAGVDSYIGAFLRSRGHVTVRSGGTWTTAGRLVLGHDGADGHLLVQGGGTVTANADTVVGHSGRTNEFVNVTGSGEVEVAGGTLHTFGDAVIALAGNVIGDVDLAGETAMWGIAGNLEVARFGKGNLAVREGADLVVLGGSTSIASEAGALDGLLTLTGIGSVLTTPGAVYVGGSSSGPGGGGTLRLLDGSTADMRRLTVWDPGTLHIDGGRVTATEALTFASGATLDFDAGELIADGAGLTRPGALSLGGTDALAPPTLRLRNGATTSSLTDLNIAAFSGAVADVEVSGTSVLTLMDDLFIGGSEFNAQGTGTLAVSGNSDVLVGGRLQIWPAGAMTVESGDVFARELRITAGALSMTGPGTALLVDAAGGFGPLDGIHVGLSGPATALAVEGGGKLAAPTLAFHVGSDTGSLATATVMDPDARLHAGAARIGGNGDGTLIVRNAAHAVFDGDLTLAAGANARGTVSVLGPSSHLVCDGTTSVGLRGTATLQVSTGATLDTHGNTRAGATLGGVSGPASGFIALSGGAQWTSAGSIFIGGDELGEQGTGLLQLQSGAIVENAGALRIWPTGTLTMLGGVLRTRELLADDATLEALGGRIRIDGGMFRPPSTSLSFGGPDPNNPADFHFVDGADAQVTFAWRIGNAPGAHGATTVRGVAPDGRRSTLLGTGGGGGADLIVGVQGTGRMDVLEGGLADFGDDILIGHQDDAIGRLAVGGVAGGLRATVRATRGGSTSRAIQVGGGQGQGVTGGRGTLDVFDGGLVETSGPLIIARNPNSRGQVTLSGSDGRLGEIRVGTDCFVAGGASSGGGLYGEILLRAGGRLVVDGTLKVWENGYVDLDEGTLRANRIDLVAAQPGWFHFFLGRVETNRIDGDLENAAGTLAPGTSIAALTLDGDYRQYGQAALEIEMADAAPGTGHDVLQVTGTATLAGMLRVVVDPGFTPAVGQTLTILTCAARSGAFDELIVEGPGRFDLVHDADAVRLVALPLPGSGDLDGDGDVDHDDVALLAGCMRGPENSEPGCAAADLDGDGDSDLADLATFQPQFTGALP